MRHRGRRDRSPSLSFAHARRNGVASSRAPERQKVGQSVAEYERVSREISLSEERKASLAAEIAEVKKDSRVDHRGADPVGQDRAQARPGHRGHHRPRRGAEGRRKTESAHRSPAAASVLAEVLGALQRMGLNPPPAILVTPEDALASVRSAILLGAVVPGLAQGDGGAGRRPDGTVAHRRLDRGRALAADRGCRRAACREEAARPAARREAAPAGRARDGARRRAEAHPKSLPARRGA